MVRRRTQSRQNNGQDYKTNYLGSFNNHKKKNKEMSKSKSRTNGKKRYDCGKIGQFFKDCWHKKKNEPIEEANIASSAYNSSGEVYVVIKPIKKFSVINLFKNADLTNE